MAVVVSPNLKEAEDCLGNLCEPVEPSLCFVVRSFLVKSIITWVMGSWEGLTEEVALFKRGSAWAA